MRTATIVLGALVLIGGLYCMFTPVATYSTLSWLIGFAMLVEGIGSIIAWNDRRKLGFTDGWSVIGASVSVVLGLILLGSFAAQFAVDLFIAYLIAAWLIVGGITRIVAALRLRDFHKRMETSVIGSKWGVLLALGVIVAMFGVLCLLEPVAVMVGIGIMLGASIVFMGADLIAHGLRM